MLDMARGGVVDANFKASRAPVDHIEGLLVFDELDGLVGLDRADIASVDQTARHVLILLGLLAVSKEHVFLKSIMCNLVN